MSNSLPTKPMVDGKTKNKSFIKIYKVLKDLGIKHNKFFLYLYDPTLQGVNVYDEENLTEELKLRIKTEIARNPWYFLREVIRIPVAGGFKKYELNRGNLAISFCMLNSLNSITMLPRQHGKTIGAISVFIWIYYFGTSNSNILFMNKEFADSKLNLKRFKDIVELLPKWLISKNKNDKDNIEEIANGTNGNTVKAVSIGLTSSEADKKGRGCTTPLQFWDEIAFLKWNKWQYGASVPATSQAKLEAKAQGKINGITLTTTPNNSDIPEGQYVLENIIEPACRFDECMYDFTLEEIEECIKKKSKNNFLYIEFTYKQLGRNDEWFEEQCRDLLHNQLLIKREILLEWTKSSDKSVYSEEQLDRIESFVKDPVSYIILRKYYKLNIYEDNIDFLKCYILACDVSTGKALDSSTINIIDPYTYEVVADFRENTIDTEDFKHIILDLVVKFFHNAIVVIENNTVSAGMISWLMKSPIKNNLYFEVKTRKTEKIEESKKELVFTKSKKKTDVYGIVTDKATRPIMFEILDRLIAEKCEVLGRRNIYSDIKNLERHKEKIEHADGQHDDSLMGYLIGIYTLEYGTNLARFRIPIKGVDPQDRKRSMTLILSELNKANIGLNKKYNGMANDIIEEEKFIQDRKNRKLNMFNQIYALDKGGDNKFDKFGRVSADI